MNEYNKYKISEENVEYKLPYELPINEADDKKREDLIKAMNDLYMKEWNKKQEDYSIQIFNEIVDKAIKCEKLEKQLEKITNIVYDCFERDRLVPYQAMKEIKKVLEDEIINK